MRKFQVNIFFSSGEAQTNGGGSLCMATNSLVKRLWAAFVAIANHEEEAQRWNYQAVE